MRSDILLLHRYALNYMFLGVICFLFRPSFNSTRFAYSELEGISSVNQPKLLAQETAAHHASALKTR